ncbi:MAG: NlpC/P60 family protein [Raoultibacter sp.]
MRERAVSNRTMGLLKVILAAVLAVTLMAPATAFADPTSTEKQAEAQAALASLNAMQEKLGVATNSYHQAVAEQEEAQGKMDEAQVRMDEANGEIANLQDRLGTRARSMYCSGGITFLDLLFGAATFEEFATNLDLLDQMNQNDADLVQQTKDLKTEIEAQRVEYTKQEKIASEKATDAKKNFEDAEATASAMQATYDSLSAEAAALIASEKAAREVAAAANAQQAIVQAANDNAASNGGGSSGGSSWTPGPSDGSIVGIARSLLGAPYVIGGKGPDSFDCSGFVAWCYGGRVPSFTGALINLPRVYDPQPGDIAVIHNGSDQHCGIYVGDGQMIHSPQPGESVSYGAVQPGMIFVRP